MTVEIRQAGAEWLVEVHGEPVGRADSAVRGVGARQLLGEAPRLRCFVAGQPGQAATAGLTDPHSRCYSGLGSSYQELGS